MSKRRATLRQIAVTFRRLGYKPRHLTEFHFDRRRRKLLSGGEGAGKSLGGALDVVGEFPFWKLGYIIGPSYDQCRKEFDYIAEALLMLHATTEKMISRPEQGRCSLTTIGEARVVTVSAEDGPKAITGKGESPDWILLVEAGKLKYSIYETAFARVSRSRGRLILTGTIEESERWYPELINKWRADNPQNAKTFIVPTWKNRVLYPGGEQDPEILAVKAVWTPEHFKERFGAEPSPPAALVLKTFSFEKHVHNWVNHIAGYPVQVWIDPGYSGSFYSVLFVQIIPRAVTRQYFKKLRDTPRSDVWVIDELYMQLAVHEEVIIEAKKKDVWQFVGKDGVGDVVMKTHPMAGDAPEQVWFQKTGIVLRGEHVAIQAGIDRHRTFLEDPGFAGEPRLFINSACDGLTGEYGRWKRKVLGENLYGDPEKTNCDALKALQYGLIAEFGYVDVAPPPKKPARKYPVTIARMRGIKQ